MGLGLVRLLQDARRFDEAEAMLYSLDAGFHGVEADGPIQQVRKTSRLTGNSSGPSGGKEHDQEEWPDLHDCLHLALDYSV